MSGENTKKLSESVKKINIDLSLMGENWSDPEYRDKSLLGLEIEARSENNGNVRIDLNIIINAICIPRKKGKVLKRCLYVGCTDIKASIHTRNGELKSYSDGKSFEVSYDKKNKKIKTGNISINPKAQILDKTNVELGSAGYRSSFESEISTSFVINENILSKKIQKDQIIWELSYPKDISMTKNYLDGNLFLFAIADWATNRVEGRIRIDPLNICLFDYNKKLIKSEIKLLIIRYLIWNEGIEIINNDGIVAEYYEDFDA